MSYRILQQAAEMRRSIYALNKQLPLSAAETVQIVEHAVKHTPSSFNSQSTRVVVLSVRHEKLWQFAEKRPESHRSGRPVRADCAKISHVQGGCRNRFVF